MVNSSFSLDLDKIDPRVIMIELNKMGQECIVNGNPQLDKVLGVNRQTMTILNCDPHNFHVIWNRSIMKKFRKERCIF